MNFIKNQFENNEKVWIAKHIKIKTGVDYYVSSNRFLLALGKKMKKSFKGELKTSRKLYGQSKTTSKKVYRVTVCFRLS